MTVKKSVLSESDLEKIYEALATAIDQATPEKEMVFLAKLSLLLAHEIGEADKVQKFIEMALEDLK